MIDYTAEKRPHRCLDVSDIPRRRMGLHYPAPDGSPRPFDLYYPAEGDGPFPVIVNVSGGGWYFGHPSSVHLGRQLHVAVQRGYAAVSIACTSSGEKKFPYQIREIYQCLRYLRENADELRLDLGFLAMLGASSGGHLSLLSALVQGQPLYDVSGAEAPPTVSAVTAIYPCCRLDAKDADFYALGLEPETMHSGPRCAESIFLGVENVHDEPELVRLASPTFQIHADAPPMLLLHGTEDVCIPYTQTLEFVRRYRQIVGNEKIQVQILRGAGHSDPVFKNDAMCHRVMDFLDRVRRGEMPCPPELQIAEG